MRAGLVGTAAFSLCVVLLAASSGRAQSPPPAPPPAAAAAPLPGFVPPYEITKIVRASGFDPLAPPRREGTTYVVRATDFRGILMRVVVDARSGALRAVSRIVPGAAPYGVGMMTPPYGPPPYGPPGYGPPPYGPPPYGPPGYGPPPYGPPPYGPADIGDPEMGPTEADLGLSPPPSAPAAIYHGAHSPAAEARPLPRPRPAGLVSRGTQPPAAKPAETPAATPDAAPAAASTPPAPAAPQKKPVQSSPIPD